MHAVKLVMCLLVVLGLSACGGSKFKRYSGPEVTQVYVSKENRKLYLLHNETVLKSYNVDLGFEPQGDKKVSGDGRTPEGFYRIDRRNPNSRFHLSIGISYPNTRDVAEAKALGATPGGDIFIHGESPKLGAGRDWTAGCIAVSNKEMEEIYAMVKNGTLIYIAP